MWRFTSIWILFLWFYYVQCAHFIWLNQGRVGLNCVNGKHSTIQQNWAFFEGQRESFCCVNISLFNRNGSNISFFFTSHTRHLDDIWKMQQIQPYGEWLSHESFITANDTFSSVLIWSSIFLFSQIHIYPLHIQIWYKLHTECVSIR